MYTSHRIKFNWYIVVVMTVIFFGIGILYMSTPNHDEAVKSHNLPKYRTKADNGAKSNVGSQVDQKAENLKEAESSHDTKIITPELAKSLLLEYEKIPNLRDRLRLVSDLMRDLCNAGYSSEAWKMIDGKSGSIRTTQIQAFFASAVLDRSEIFAKISNIAENGYENEQLGALSAYMSRYRTSEIDSLIDDPQFKNIANSGGMVRFKGMMRNYLVSELSIKDEGAQRAAVDAADRFFEKGFLRGGALLSILQKADLVDPFEKWKTISELIPNVSDDPEGHREYIVQEMILDNAPKAMDALISSDNTQSDKDFSVALKKWAVSEPGAANRWYGLRGKDLREDQQDTAAKAFSELAKSYGENDVAIKWANQIKNIEQKNKILNELNSAAPQN